jgi:hypothetical protein
MTSVSTPILAPIPIAAPDADRLVVVAGEAERLARTDAAAARERLQVLRGLVAGLPGAHPEETSRFVCILDQLDADLQTGAVRSITGLTRRVRQLERLAR